MSGSTTFPLILCVDDHDSGLEIRRMLLERSGYRVVTAKTATEGLQHVERGGGDIRLVITDFFLPDMNGLELASKVKTLTPGVPVMMLTGSMEDLEKNPDAIDSFLMKGGSTEELLAEIKALLPPGNKPS